jgi:hypothetical protein
LSGGHHWRSADRAQLGRSGYRDVPPEVTAGCVVVVGGSVVGGSLEVGGGSVVVGGTVVVGRVTCAVPEPGSDGGTGAGTVVLDDGVEVVGPDP